MKNVIALCILALPLVATPALARDGESYIGIEGGVTFPRTSVITVTPSGSSTSQIITPGTNYKTGYDVDFVVGHDFGMIRFEGEGAYKRVLVQNYSNALNASGRTKALSVMANLLLDVPSGDRTSFYIGGGAGIARIYDRVLASNGATIVNQSDARLAWQGIAGLRHELSDNVDLGLKARYFDAGRSHLRTPGNAAWSGKFRTISVMASLIFNLGERQEMAPPPPPPPPPPAPPPPPPPPPLAVVCNKGPYIVFFDWDKSDITLEASTILDSASSAYGNCERVPVMIAGYADRSGSPGYNQGLSERRATNVRGYMTARGIDDGAITTQAFGESNNRVPTADGVRELQNRRVEIGFGPGSGN